MELLLPAILSIPTLLLIAVYLHWVKIGGLALKGLAPLNIALICLLFYALCAMLFEGIVRPFGFRDGVLGWTAFGILWWLIITTLPVTVWLQEEQSQDLGNAQYS